MRMQSKIVALIGLPLLAGCASLKTGTGAAIGAATGSLLGGLPGATAGALTGGVATSLITQGLSPGQCPQPVTGFWPMLGELIHVGGWVLGAVILVPLIMGYLIPNGLVRHKNANKNS